MPASGKTTIALTPCAARPWMSEIAFWVFPWPSAYWKLETLGQRLASAWASARVIRRQLLSPKPSASARLIFLVPHQDGALPFPVAVPPWAPEPDPPPQLAASRAAIRRMPGGLHRR